MNTMDNAQAILALETLTIALYLQNLIFAPLHKITLFPIFPYTAAPNLSDPRYFALVDNLQKIVELNSGCFYN